MNKTDDSQHDQPRYSGIPTFLRLPHQPDATDLDIALVGIPYDGGVTFRPGARHGPPVHGHVLAELVAVPDLRERGLAGELLVLGRRPDHGSLEDDVAVVGLQDDLALAHAPYRTS